MTENEQLSLESFKNHLESASNIVNKWPDWKRNIFGKRDISPSISASGNLVRIRYGGLEDDILMCIFRPGYIENFGQELSDHINSLKGRYIEEKALYICDYFNKTKENYNKIYPDNWDRIMPTYWIGGKYSDLYIYDIYIYYEIHMRVTNNSLLDSPTNFYNGPVKDYDNEKMKKSEFNFYNGN